MSEVTGYSVLPQITDQKTDCAHGFEHPKAFRIYFMEHYEHIAATLRANGRGEHANDIEFFSAWVRHLSGIIQEMKGAAIKDSLLAEIAKQGGEKPKSQAEIMKKIQEIRESWREREVSKS